MPENKNEINDVVIPVEHIREMVMPPYPYQKFENGFGMLGSVPDKTEEKDQDNSSKK
ncbi:MAG: hypothetical protein OXG88_09885 [Gammaproteobacteria bacterium]|nr:hypothetical protein [Gammaproteobacteria bacterium]